MRCKICHKINEVNTRDENLYKSSTVKDNYVCYYCSQTVKRIKLHLTCKKCQKQFTTRVLLQNQNIYNDWVCSLCDDKPIEKNTLKISELACSSCRVDNGTCHHPELPCSLSKNFVEFLSNFLCSIKGSDDCSILSIYGIDKSRLDIHALKYVPLFKNQYSVSPNNLVLIRQRLNSKKNYITNILIYNFNKKWNEVYNEKFDKGMNWTENVIRFLIKDFNKLVI